MCVIVKMYINLLAQRKRLFGIRGNSLTSGICELSGLISSYNMSHLNLGLCVFLDVEWCITRREKMLHHDNILQNLKAYTHMRSLLGHLLIFLFMQGSVNISPVAFNKTVTLSDTEMNKYYLGLLNFYSSNYEVSINVIKCVNQTKHASFFFLFLISMFC